MAVRWSPDGRHILSTADFQVCACVEMHCKTYTYVVLPVCCIEGSCNVYWQTWFSLHLFKQLYSFQLRISVWSLVSKSVSYIKYPKHANAGNCYIHAFDAFITGFISLISLITAQCFVLPQIHVQSSTCSKSQLFFF